MVQFLILIMLLFIILSVPVYIAYRNLYERLYRFRKKRVRYKPKWVKLLVRCNHCGLLFPYVVKASSCEELRKKVAYGEYICVECPFCGQQNYVRIGKFTVIGGNCNV